VKSEREQQLAALTKRGADVLQRQHDEQRRAELEAKHAQQRHELSQEAGRNRQIGRLNRPWLGTAVVTGVVVPITAAAIYGFLNSGLFIAVWIQLLIWIVILPAVALGVVAERILAARLGVADRQATRAWAESLPFLLSGYEPDFRRSDSSFVLRFRFESDTPQAEQLVQVLAGVDDRVVVTLAEYPGAPESESDELISIAAIGRYDGPEPSEDGSFALNISHRNRHYCRTWLPGWADSAVSEALQPLHKLYALTSVEFTS